MEPLEYLIKRIKERWKDQKKLKVERMDLDCGYFRYILTNETDAICAFDEDDYPTGAKRWDAKKNAERFAGAAKDIQTLFEWIKCLENDLKRSNEQ